MTRTGSKLVTAAIVHGMWAAWGAGDRAGVLAFLAADAVLALHIPLDVVPFGGETSGLASISDRLQMSLDQFETLKYDALLIKCDGEYAHGMIDYAIRHKVTGETLEGSMRQVLRVRGHCVVRIDEYHDVDRVRAFMRLVAYAAATLGQR